MPLTHEQVVAMLASLDDCARRRAALQPLDPLLGVGIRAEAAEILRAAHGDDRALVRQHVRRLMLDLDLPGVATPGVLPLSATAPEPRP